MPNAWPPDPHDYDYVGFELVDTDEYCRAQFQRKYGRPPEWIVTGKGMKFVGPIDEKGEGDD